MSDKKYEELFVTEVKFKGATTLVKWEDFSGDDKSIASVDKLTKDFEDTLPAVKEILALHLDLPQDRMYVTGVSTMLTDDGVRYYTLEGKIYSKGAGVENKVSCKLPYNPDAEYDDLAYFNCDEQEKIYELLMQAGFYAQGNRKKVEPTLFDGAEESEESEDDDYEELIPDVDYDPNILDISEDPDF